MFITLRNVQKGEAVSLSHCLDNRNGTLKVALRSIIYWVGWHNVDAGETLSWKEVGSSTIDGLRLDPGLYSLAQLAEKFQASVPGLELSVDHATGVTSMTVPPSHNVRISSGLRTMLGLDDKGWLDEGVYLGDHLVDFAIHKSLNVHLDEVSTTGNLVDGRPSTLIGIVPVPCLPLGGATSFSYPNPEFRCLRSGLITELKVGIRDDIEQLIDNHDLPISVVLEIIPN